MSRRTLSKTEVKELGEKLRWLSINLSKHDNVELVEEGGVTSYSVNGEKRFLVKEGRLIPHLRFVLTHPTITHPTNLKRITVDVGAVRFVANGADVMRPGIVEIDDGIAPGELVVVVDQTYGKPLAVGEALLGSEEMRAASSGKAVRTLHHVGDKEWKTTK